jgi:hypothetical protein
MKQTDCAVWMRIMVGCVAGALVGPALVVALFACRVPVPVAVALVVIAVAACARHPVALARLVPLLPRSRPWLAAWLIVSAVAGVQNARLAAFMIDPSRADLSVFPERSFFRQHSCATAYTEATRLAATGANVYDPALYRDPESESPRHMRSIGPFEVDQFEYPPPFLLLPRVGSALGLDFFAQRRIWFALQSLTWLLAVLGLARWIGGRPGIIAAALVPVTMALPTTLLNLQIGNFQITVFALCVLAMLAFARSWHVPGGLALGFAALSKVFPGVLGLLLLGGGRRRPVAWTLGAALALVGLALWSLGTGPFVDFVSYQLPRLASGDAFPWAELPPVAAINGGVYGMLTKLRALGVPGTDKGTAAIICHLYAVAVVMPLAWLAARRLRRAEGLLRPVEHRLRQAQTWLALLSLAAARSPFLPDVYATLGSLWLLTLIAAEGASAARLFGLALTGVACCWLLDVQALPSPLPVWLLLATLGIQLVMLSLHVWAVARPLQPQIARDLVADAAPAEPRARLA